MARIPEDQIERIKQTVPIERLCRRYNIELKAQGKNLVGTCPFHADDTPSFIVTPEKNLWHCMGACDEGGNVFNLVMKTRKGHLPQSVPDPVRIDRRCARRSHRHHLQGQTTSDPCPPGRRIDRRRVVGARGRLLPRRFFRRPGSGQVP